MCNFGPPSINNTKHTYFIFKYNLLGFKDVRHTAFDNIGHILATTPSMNSLGEFTHFGTAETNITVRPFD